MKNTKRIAYLGVLIAVIVVLAAVPQIGFIQIPPLSLTIVHIPVIIGAIALKGNAGIILSLAFGIASWAVASSRGAATDLLFMNPLVSVLPRVIFGIVLTGLVNIMDKIKMKDSLKNGVIALVGSLVHSLIVLFALMVSIGLSSNNLFSLDNWGLLLGAFFALNVIGEAIASVILTVPVVKALKSVID